MPLLPGKKNIGNNIEELKYHGKKPRSHDQIVAIALSNARKHPSKSKKKEESMSKVEENIKKHQVHVKVSGKDEVEPGKGTGEQSVKGHMDAPELAKPNPLAAKSHPHEVKDSIMEANNVVPGADPKVSGGADKYSTHKSLKAGAKNLGSFLSKCCGKSTGI